MWRRDGALLQILPRLTPSDAVVVEELIKVLHASPAVVDHGMHGGGARRRRRHVDGLEVRHERLLRLRGCCGGLLSSVLDGALH